KAWRRCAAAGARRSIRWLTPPTIRAMPASSSMLASRSSAAIPFRSWSARAKRSKSSCAGNSRTYSRSHDAGTMTANEKFDITLNINGQDYPIRVEARRTLVDAIRDDCGQTGTHIGCEHGVCGTCTVIVNDEAVRSCLMFAVQADGKKIRTVEGLADGDKLSVLQQAFIDNHGLQCGYCTPGFLMLITNALEKNPDIDDEELLDVLASNLCRCTGYQNIIKAAKAARDEMRGAKVTA